MPQFYFALAKVTKFQKKLEYQNVFCTTMLQPILLHVEMWRNRKSYRYRSATGGLLQVHKLLPLQSFLSPRLVPMQSSVHLQMKFFLSAWLWTADGISSHSSYIEFSSTKHFHSFLYHFHTFIQYVHCRCLGKWQHCQWQCYLFPQFVIQFLNKYSTSTLTYRIVRG